MLRPNRVWQLLIVVLLLLLLVACSKVKFAYNQLDWLIPYYTRDYLDLSDNQRTYLDEAVNDLLYWHCGSQLSDYAALLRKSNRDFQNLSMDERKLALILTDMKSYWKEIKRQASPAIAELFATSSQSQIDEFFSRLEEKNQQWLKDFRGMSAETLRQEQEEGITEELERWFGPLHDAQRKIVSAWSLRFEPLGKMGLEARQSWQEALRRLLENRDDAETLSAGVERLFVDPERIYIPSYLQRLEDNQRITLEMVAGVSLLLNEEQRKHLDKKINSIADDLDELACRGEPKQEVRPTRSSFSPLDDY